MTEPEFIQFWYKYELDCYGTDTGHYFVRASYSPPKGFYSYEMLVFTKKEVAKLTTKDLNDFLFEKELLATFNVRE